MGFNCIKVHAQILLSAKTNGIYMTDIPIFNTRLIIRGQRSVDCWLWKSPDPNRNAHAGVLIGPRVILFWSIKIFIIWVTWWVPNNYAQTCYSWKVLINGHTSLKWYMNSFWFPCLVKHGTKQSSTLKRWEPHPLQQMLGPGNRVISSTQQAGQLSGSLVHPVKQLPRLNKPHTAEALL